MPSSYPTSIPAYAQNGGQNNSTDTLSINQHTSRHQQHQDDIIAIATKVGTGASTPANNTVLRGNGSGTSGYDSVHAASDISGVLGVSNGGTGVTSSTGLGNVVLNNSPSLTTPTLSQPTISDFTNAQHNHSNAVGGGSLNASNALQAGSVNFANLLSTIFGGQVQTQANAGTAGGNMWYINLGGIKLCWGQTTQNLSSHNAPNYSVTLPTSFFSTVQMAPLLTLPTVNVDINQVVVGSSFNTSAFAFYANSIANSVSATLGVGWLVIGT